MKLWCLEPFSSGWGIWTLLVKDKSCWWAPVSFMLSFFCCDSVVLSVSSVFFFSLKKSNEKAFINAVRANGALQLSPRVGRKTFYLSESSWYLRLKQRMMRWVLCWQVFHRASSSLWPWLYWKSLPPFNIFILGFPQRQCTHIIPKWQCYKFLSY